VLRTAIALLVPAIVTLGGSGLAHDGGRPPRSIVIKAGRLIDVRGGRVLTDRAILVEGERIKSVSEADEILKQAPDATAIIDLSKATVLPGLIDGHTHVFLQGFIPEQVYDDQLLKESIPYRTIRATVAARIALTSGFTALRDLETEGAMYADVDLKRAIQKDIIPGPRMSVPTRALSPTGTYPLLGYSWELKVPEGVQVVDGPDEIRKAVREQVKFGADWIKFYADRGERIDGGEIRSKVNFTGEEMRALVGEAHRLDRRVAAHAMGIDGIMAALGAGVDSTEHGMGLDTRAIDLMAEKGVYWCPTIYSRVYIAERLPAGDASALRAMLGRQKEAFGLAMRKGVKIVYGTDIGGYPWGNGQAKDFEYMVEYGMTPMQAIRSATTVAAELLPAQDDLGAIEPGKYADIVAVAGDPLADIAELERVKFAMKGGQVFKDEIGK
jgi:imidazolonepropionase-like amidohydrolase